MNQQNVNYLLEMDRKRVLLIDRLNNAKPFSPEYFLVCELIKTHDEDYFDYIKANAGSPVKRTSSLKADAVPLLAIAVTLYALAAVITDFAVKYLP